MSLNRNDPRSIKELAARAASVAAGLGDVKIMHVCGTHEHTIVTSGLRSFLPSGVRLVSGPGCPVCITPKEDIERMIFLAEQGLTVTTFGDMLNIPTDSGSLADARARGADVRMVYGISQALSIARDECREVVHFGIGFETTVPTSSVALLSRPESFSILSVHRTIPPALTFLHEHGIAVDGFIDPGHVCSIIGTKPFEPLAGRYGTPHVVAGFEPGDVLMAVYMLLLQIRDGRHDVENEYARAVRSEGNRKAQQLISATFEPCDAAWRALPDIPGSGLAITSAFREHDALWRHRDLLGSFEYERGEEDGACRCKDMLLGECMPRECPLFGAACTPDSPVGPCMVSAEGTCSIAYKYGGGHDGA
jgi:hydrogenase expression/formation protein HypD